MIFFLLNFESLILLQESPLYHQHKGPSFEAFSTLQATDHYRRASGDRRRGGSFTDEYNGSDSEAIATLH